MKTIVISAINIHEAGPLSVYKDCVQNIAEMQLYKYYKIILFVHKKELFSEFDDKFTIIELPRSRKSYFHRFFYEYLYFYYFSINTKIYAWLSLHDITPNVKAARRFVYCHNASPFYKMTNLEKRFAPKLRFFNLFYKYLYKINIKKNNNVIVQQNWMKEKFANEFKLSNVIVSYPNVSINRNEDFSINNVENNNIFFYPSYPRVFKNFEVICEASKIICNKGYENFEIILTIDGTENSYSRYIVEKYKHISNLNFVGLINRNEVYSNYAKSACLIFPSKLESWGLPITEFKQFGKPIILSDLPYAREVVGKYNRVKFFNPYSSEELANIIISKINGKIEWDKVNSTEEPDFNNWKDLIKHLFF